MNWQSIQQHMSYYSDNRLKLMVLSIALRELAASDNSAGISNAAFNTNGFDFTVLSNCDSTDIKIPDDLQKLLSR